MCLVSIVAEILTNPSKLYGIPLTLLPITGTIPYTRTKPVLHTTFQISLSSKPSDAM
jgi:hypothetical protein